MYRRSIAPRDSWARVSGGEGCRFILSDITSKRPCSVHADSYLTVNNDLLFPVPLLYLPELKQIQTL